MKTELNEQKKILKKVKKITRIIGKDKEEAKKTIKVLIATYDISPLLFVQKIG